MSADHALPTIVVPCFNEARRLDEARFVALAESGRLNLLFVDDGSTDPTCTTLLRLAGASPAISVCALPHNQGKSEAVRTGLLEAVTQGASIVGYYDADLATPPDELLRLLTVIDTRPEIDAVFGSRVAKLGSIIERTNLRHSVGRIYATAASWALGVPVYDTQCGLKLFRVTPTFVDAIAEPFASRWAFDVELLGRLLTGTANSPGVAVDAFLEVPLNSWKDVGGSHLRASDGIAALWQVVAIGLRRRKSS